MRMHLKNAYLAVPRALTLESRAGLADAVPAGAAPAPASGPAAITTVTDTVFAGYVTGGTEQFTATSPPMCRWRRAGPLPTRTPSPASRSSPTPSVRTRTSTCAAAEATAVSCSDQADAEGHFQLSPSVGDVLRMRASTATQQHAADEFAATNAGRTTPGRSRWALRARWSTATAAPGATFTNFFSGVFSPPAPERGLWRPERRRLPAATAPTARFGAGKESASPHGGSP